MKTYNLALSEDTVRALLKVPNCFLATEYKTLREIYGRIQDEKYENSKVNYINNFR